MLELFRNMVKEEWRMHSSIFGSFSFALFPIIILAFSFFGSLFLPIFEKAIPLSTILLIMQVSFILFGLSIGSFGLLGREVMNRRFGQASLLAFSSRSLPISEKIIFLNFFVKDLIYYFFLWIVPFFLGFALYSWIASISLIYPLALLSILTLSFLMGLSVAFLLSTIYAHSARLLFGVIAILAIGGVYSSSFADSILSEILVFSSIPSPLQTAFYLITAVSFSAISLYFIKVDYPQKKRFFKNSLSKLSKLFSFSKYSVFIAKDFLDFKRSEGGIGKILFSFILPLGLIFWLLNSVLSSLIPFSNALVLFAVFLGIMSSSFYNWLTEYDLFNSYSFLPVNSSTIMKSKVISYLLINIIPLVILIAVAAWTNSLEYFLPSVAVFISISLYALSIIAYLGGLNPNTMLYNAKIFLEYMFSLSPVLLIMIFVSILNPFYLIASIILIPVSYKILEKSYVKWDSAELL